MVWINNSSVMSSSTVKLIMVGSSASGKSSILAACAGEIFRDQYLPTIGIDFKSLHLGDSVPVKASVWDCSGEKRYRTIRDNYYSGADGCVVVYDVTSRESFVAVRGFVEEYRKHVLKGPILVLGNKTDSRPVMDPLLPWSVSTEEGRVMAHSLGAFFSEVSAKDTSGVKSALTGIATFLGGNAEKSSAR